MFRREGRSGLGTIEKRKSFAAGRWAMLGLLGAGAVTLAAQQSRRRKPLKTPLDYAIEQAEAERNAAANSPHYVEAVGGAGLQTQPEPLAQKINTTSDPVAQSANSAPEEGSKMADAAPLREHEFNNAPRQRKPHREQNETRIVDQHQMEPDAIAAGGDIGELEGDKQSFGEVPTIMDQNETTPAFAQQN